MTVKNRRYGVVSRSLLFRRYSIGQIWHNWLSSVRRRFGWWLAAMLAFFVAPITALAWSDNNANHGQPSSASKNSPANSRTNHASQQQPLASNPDQTSSSQSNSQNSNHQTTTSVNVNGQDIAVPNNGELHQTIKSGNSQTRIDLSIHNQTSDGQATNRSKSYSSVQIYSNSQQSTSQEDDMH